MHVDGCWMNGSQPHGKVHYLYVCIVYVFLLHSSNLVIWIVCTCSNVAILLLRNSCFRGCIDGCPPCPRTCSVPKFGHYIYTFITQFSLKLNLRWWFGNLCYGCISVSINLRGDPCELDSGRPLMHDSPGYTSVFLMINIQLDKELNAASRSSHLFLFLFLLLPPRAYIQRYKNKWYVACSFSKEMSVQFWAQGRKAKSKVNYHGVGRFESVEIMESQAYEK